MKRRILMKNKGMKNQEEVILVACSMLHVTGLKPATSNLELATSSHHNLNTLIHLQS